MFQFHSKQRKRKQTNELIIFFAKNMYLRKTQSLYELSPNTIYSKVAKQPRGTGNKSPTKGHDRKNFCTNNELDTRLFYWDKH